MIAGLLCALVVHVASAHDSGGYRSDTPGLGVSCEAGPYVGAAGVFSNSEGTNSRYVVGGLQAGAWGPLRVGVVAGVIDGYRGNHGRPQAVAAGLLSVDLGSGYGLRFLAVPRVSGASPGVVHAAFTVGL